VLLSKREREVLELLASGMTHPDIARELWLGLNTVYAHSKRIRRYFGVHTTLEAVAKARLWDVI
jgi:DNA-binding CsgD family transcriptional regulator